MQTCFFYFYDAKVTKTHNRQRRIVMNYEQPVENTTTRKLFYSIYGWMTVALAITAGTAYGVLMHEPFIKILLTRPSIGIALLIAQLVVVIVFSALLSRLSYGTALALFILYAILSGITFSVIFYYYSPESITKAFFISAGMFGSMAIYGYMTHTDLSKMGTILRMALWGMILALIINMFLHSSGFDFILSILGVILFSVLTAYTVNMIKQLAAQLEDTDRENYLKIGLLGAFQLYLNFLNLFLNILNLTGKRRE